MDPRSVNLLIPHESMITYHGRLRVHQTPIWIRDVWVVVEHRTMGWILAVVTHHDEQGDMDAVSPGRHVLWYYLTTHVGCPDYVLLAITPPTELASVFDRVVDPVLVRQCGILLGLP